MKKLTLLPLILMYLLCLPRAHADDFYYLYNRVGNTEDVFTARKTQLVEDSLEFFWLEGSNKGNVSNVNRADVYDPKIVQGDVKSGVQVYVLQPSLPSATVLGINTLGQIAIEINDGQTKRQRIAGLYRKSIAVTSGCNINKICVGQDIVMVNGLKQNKVEFSNVKLLGIDVDGHFVGIDLKTGDKFVNILPADIAQTAGCNSLHICVGQEFYDTAINAFIKVISFSSDNHFHNLILTGPKMGSDYVTNSVPVSIEKYCLKDICVGETYFNVGEESSKYVVIGIQEDKKAILATSENLRDIKKTLDIGWLSKETPKKCDDSGELCVKDMVIYDKSHQAQILGIQTSGLFILGSDNSQPIVDVDPKSIVRIKGCDSQNRLCAGKEYYISTRNMVRAKLLGFNYDKTLLFGTADASFSVAPDEVRASGCVKAICNEKDFN